MSRPRPTGESAHTRIKTGVAAVPHVYERKKAHVAFQMVGRDALLISEGRLQFQQFSITRQVGPDTSRLALGQAGREVGYCRLDHEASEASSVIVHVEVLPEFRRCGLAGVLVHLALRHELETCSRTSLAFRMRHRLEWHHRISESHNFAIAVLARRLGFTPEINPQWLFRVEEIESVETIPAKGDAPPAYAVRLKSDGAVTIAYPADPQTGRLLPADHWFHDFPTVPATINELVSKRALIVANINYLLRRDGVGELLNHLAHNPEEARSLAGHIVALT